MIGASAVLVFATLSGIGRSVASARKSDPRYFDAGLGEGTALGVKALGRATVYAVGGVGLLTFAVCKAMGVHSLAEFRQKMETILKKRVPDIPRSSTPGRSDFKSFRELFEYLDEQDRQQKQNRPDSR